MTFALEDEDDGLENDCLGEEGVSRWPQNSRIRSGSGMEKMRVAEALRSVQSGATKLLLKSAVEDLQACAAIAEQLKISQTIRLVELDGNRLGDAGVEQISQVLCSGSSMQLLSLANNEIGDAGIKSIAENLESNNTLSRLELSGNRCGAVGCAWLSAALQKNVALRSLWVNSNRLGPEGALRMAKALSINRTLKVLGLNHNRIGDLGAAALANALSEPSATLVALSVGRNHIADDGISELAQMLRVNGSLQELHVDQNNFRDRAGRALAEAVTVNSTLRVLSAVKNRLGSETVALFVQALDTNKTIQRLCLSSEHQLNLQAAASVPEAQLGQPPQMPPLVIPPAGAAAAELAGQQSRAGGWTPRLSLRPWSARGGSCSHQGAPVSPTSAAAGPGARRAGERRAGGLMDWRWRRGAKPQESNEPEDATTTDLEEEMSEFMPGEEGIMALVLPVERGSAGRSYHIAGGAQPGDSGHSQPQVERSNSQALSGLTSPNNGTPQSEMCRPTDVLSFPFPLHEQPLSPDFVWVEQPDQEGAGSVMSVGRSAGDEPPVFDVDKGEKDIYSV